MLKTRMSESLVYRIIKAGNDLWEHLVQPPTYQQHCPHLHGSGTPLGMGTPHLPETVHHSSLEECFLISSPTLPSHPRLFTSAQSCFVPCEPPTAHWWPSGVHSPIQHPLSVAQHPHRAVRSLFGNADRCLQPL